MTRSHVLSLCFWVFGCLVLVGACVFRSLPPPSSSHWKSTLTTDLQTWYIILHTRADHPTIEQAIRDTWTQKLSAHERFDFIVGLDQSEPQHDPVQNYLALPVAETFANILRKTLQAWDYMLKTNASWQWTVRTNNGTYFQPQRLRHLPRQNFFGGHITFSDFVGGWFMVFSRDVIERLVAYVQAHPHQVDQTTVGDDVWLSHTVVQQLHVPMVQLDTVYWNNEEPVATLSKTAQAYRLSLPLGPNKTGRVSRFYSLHEQWT